MSFDMPPASAGFDARAGWFVKRLNADTRISFLHGAAIAGNMGGESGLLCIHEAGLPENIGGVSWCQWTGSRRRQFEEWCAGCGLDWHEDEAAYGFFLCEIRSSMRWALTKLVECRTLWSATLCWERYYEAPASLYGSFPRRYRFARRAFKAAQG